jgi:GT2 family glycosyltransferase
MTSETPDEDRPQGREAAVPDLSVIIVSWNTLELTRAALSSVRAHLGSIPHEVIVVDNDSSDGTPRMIEDEFPEVRLVHNTENVGFGRANNQAMAISRAGWMLLLNSDAELIDDSVAELFRRIRGDHTIGVAHCRLVSPDGTIQYSTYRFPSVKVALMDNFGLSRLMPARSRPDLLGGYWDQSYERDVDGVAGAFMLVPRNVYLQTGGFDERIFMYGEDLEWCQRIRGLGLRVRYFPDATVMHHHHASSGKLLGDHRRMTASLSAQKTMVRERDGVLAAAAYISLLILGALLRLAYYTIRGRGTSPDNERFRSMIQPQVAVLRALFSLLRGDA